LLTDEDLDEEQDEPDYGVTVGVGLVVVSGLPVYDEFHYALDEERTGVADAGCGHCQSPGDEQRPEHDMQEY
jgi:hypothetical protein